DGFADIIVGVPDYTAGQYLEGRAYVYLGSASGLGATPVWRAEGNQADASFGTSLASAGDVNGDGFDDVVVGATGYTDGQNNEGAALVYLGSAQGLSNTPAWSQEGNVEGAAFGGSVGTAGDVNGDGFDDVVVGAPTFGHQLSYQGMAALYLGSASGLSATP